MPAMSKSALLMYCSVAVFLVACGGRSDTPMPPRAAIAAVPVAASQDSSGRAVHRIESSAASSEDEEPVDVSMLKLPQPEDTEPVPVK
jgi:hypothetical protein